VSSVETSTTRAFYTESGPHATTAANARIAAETAEAALAAYAEMGFRAPPSDTACSSHGGDGKLDVYLVLFAGADGTTVRESCNGQVCASYILSEASFRGRGYKDAREGFETVVPHEAFHAVQNAYDAELDRFWAEGTAQWAAKHLRPQLTDLEKNLPAFFADSSRSIDNPPGGAVAGFLYGAAIWPVFLTEHHDDRIILDALDAEANGASSLAAVDQALVSRGSSLAKDFPLFVAWNACTAERAGTGGYQSAADYPAVKSIEEFEGSPSAITSGYSNFTYHVTATKPTQASIATDAQRNGAVLVPLAGGACALDKAAPLPATFDGEALIVVSGITAKKSDAPFTLSLADAPAPAAADSGGCALSPAVRSSWLGPLFAAMVLLLRRRRSA